MQQLFLDLTIATLFSFFFAQLVSCSEQPCMLRCYESLQLTKESLDHFTAHLAKGSTDPLVVELQRLLSIHGPDQEPCLRYLISSVVLCGKVDERGLKAMGELFGRREGLRLSSLLGRLEQENSLDVVAQFIAEHVGCDRFFADFGMLICKLIGENWSAMERLMAMIMGTVKDDKISDYGLQYILRLLPAEWQYDLINSGRMFLEVVKDVYRFNENNPLLREIFFLARCSSRPSPKIRKYIADNFDCFRTSLAEDGALNVQSTCHDNVPELTDDALCHISRFMDIETLTAVMPLVCNAWRSVHWRVVMQDTRIQDLYLLDMVGVNLQSIHTKAPWKYCLRNEASALEYFGRCIEYGALDRTRLMGGLTHSNLEEYVAAVAEGRAILPRRGDCATHCDAFIKLFERVYEFCRFSVPKLDKPVFLTDEEYERAVYHFAYERRWVLELHKSLIMDDMPKLFSIIREDEEVMEKLVRMNFGDSFGAALGLIVCGKAKKIPDKLARLIFSQTDMFKTLIEPAVVPSTEYHDAVVESDMLPKVMKRAYVTGRDMFPEFLISHMLAIKGDADKISKTAASISQEFGEQDRPKLQDVERSLLMGLYGQGMKLHGYSAEDIESFERTMIRCGLL